MAINALLVAKGLVEPIIAGLVARSKLQVFVLPKGFLSRLDSLRVRHVYALRERSDGDVGKALDHLHARRLVLPVVVVEVATTCHNDRRIGPVVFENLAKAFDVAVSVHESAPREIFVNVKKLP